MAGTTFVIEGKPGAVFLARTYDNGLGPKEPSSIFRTAWDAGGFDESVGHVAAAQAPKRDRDNGFKFEA